MKNNISKLPDRAPAFYGNAGKGMPSCYVTRDASEVLMDAGLSDAFAVPDPYERKIELVRLVEGCEGVSAIYVNGLMVIGTSSKKPAGRSKARHTILQHLESGLGMERDVSRAMISVFGANAADIGSEIVVNASGLVNESGMIRAPDYGEGVQPRQRPYGMDAETEEMFQHAKSLFKVSDEEALDMVERVKSIKYISLVYDIDTETAMGVLDHVADGGIPRTEISTRDISHIVGHVSREIAARTRPAPGIREAPKRPLHTGLLHPEQMERYLGETGERIEDSGDSHEDGDPSIRSRDTDLEIPIVSLLSSEEDNEVDENFNEGIEFIKEEFGLDSDAAKRLYILLEEEGKLPEGDSVGGLQEMHYDDVAPFIQRAEQEE